MIKFSLWGYIYKNNIYLYFWQQKCNMWLKACLGLVVSGCCWQNPIGAFAGLCEGNLSLSEAWRPQGSNTIRIWLQQSPEALD